MSYFKKLNRKETKYRKHEHSPPNESRSNLVSFESRTGTCALFSASALIHFPSALSERLIDLASSKVCPSLPAEWHTSQQTSCKIVHYQRKYHSHKKK